jgi:hypothetical protein
MVNIVIVLFLLPVAASVNFDSCILEVRNGTYGSVGGTDNNGHPVLDISKATGITYDLCIRACGASSEPFVWPTFAQQVGTWLLPWLALVSQLPFGANDKLDNLVSVFLTVGSPTLAAYSLALTVLNGRWIARRFAAYNYPNIRYAVQILSSLQQSPLTVTTTGSLLASLVILPENNEWWSELFVWLNYTHAWSVSAVTSIAWVVIAYVITQLDVFIHTAGRTNHFGIGSLWLWLLPIVIGWLQVSPKCDSMRLRQAIDRANKIAYVATPSGKPVLASSVSMQRAISLSISTDDPLRCDEECTAPIYNYSRIFTWAQAVENIFVVFREASDRSHILCSVDPQVHWETTEKAPGPNPRNRIGTLSQVEAYCLPVEPTGNRGSRWTHGVWSRFLVASVLALSLQWGTTGGAIVIVWFSPTTGKLSRRKQSFYANIVDLYSLGLGCRSAAYLLYGVLSTIIWMMLVLSSFLCHYSTIAGSKRISALAEQLSIVLRRLGKVVACFNAMWIVVLSLLHLSGYFQRCYCNSCVLGWGARAFNTILLTDEDKSWTRSASIGGAVLAAVSAIICVVFVNLFINPELPE